MAKPPFTLWLEFETWQSSNGDDPSDDFFNMTITLADGKEYALNVWTFTRFERALRETQQSGDFLSGTYLLPPDLFIERLDRKLIEKVVTDLIWNGDLREEWRVIGK